MQNDGSRQDHIGPVGTQLQFTHAFFIRHAVKTLDQYLVIAPTGPNAEAAKGVLPELKKMIK